jgi:pimeloyl-ACP methyl ester carboxylesterase
VNPSFATRNGGSIYVEDSGAGPVLLALHGLGGGAWFFSGFANRLAPRFRVIAVDLPGTGRSRAGTAPFGIESWVQDLGDLVASRTPDPVVIVGHSLGTILALEAWKRWPERIRGMVFVGGLPEPRPPVRERLAARAEVAARNGLHGMGPSVVSANFAATTISEQPELTGLFGRLFETQDPHSYVRCCEILIGASAEAIVSTVRVPVLSITGSEDQYAPPSLVAEFTSRVPGRRGDVVLDGCAHLPFLEAPRAFADAVESFLETLC